MSYAPKYIVYQCNVCNRQTELVLDGNRPDPIRCNITQKCRGKFSRVGERSVREFLFTPLVPGLPDYIPRGTAIIPAPQLTVPNPITVFTAAGDGVIALAGIYRTNYGGWSDWYVTEKDTGDQVVLESNEFDEPQACSIRAVLFEISAELLTASKYVYEVPGPVSIVGGKDASPEAKSLRFTNSNNITVYVNGIELISSQFDRSVNDQITFTPTIYDSNNVVEVFVFQDFSTAVNHSVHVPLSFNSLISTVTHDAALRQLDCWGNYFASKIDGVERYTLFCTDLSKLNPNKSYGVKQFEVTDQGNITRIINSSDVFILLGKEPFSFKDKELYAYLTGTALVDHQSVMTYNQSVATGGLYLTVDSSVITQVYNPISTSKIDAAILSTTTVAVSGTALAGSENLDQKYILGPT